MIENLHKVGGSTQRINKAKTFLWQGKVHEAIAHTLVGEDSTHIAYIIKVFDNKLLILISALNCLSTSS
jgi:hypothetical protein